MSSTATVELMGLPGSGKTRLAHDMLAEAARRRLPASCIGRLVGPDVPTSLRLLRKGAMVGAELTSRPVRSAAVATAVVRSRQARAADVPGRTVQGLIAQRLLRRAVRRRELSIVDEGVLQALWSTAWSSTAAPVLRLHYDSRTRPDAVVLLDCAPELAAARLRARESNHSRLQLLRPEALLVELARGQRLFEQLAEQWQQLAGVSALLRIDAAAPDVPAAVRHLVRS